jgi:hypothetical protein
MSLPLEKEEFLSGIEEKVLKRPDHWRTANQRRAVPSSLPFLDLLVIISNVSKENPVIPLARCAPPPVPSSTTAIAGGDSANTCNNGMLISGGSGRKARHGSIGGLLLP